MNFASLGEEGTSRRGQRFEPCRCFPGFVPRILVGRVRHYFWLCGQGCFSPASIDSHLRGDRGPGQGVPSGTFRFPELQWDFLFALLPFDPERFL